VIGMDGSYPASMQVFFTTEKEIGLFVSFRQRCIAAFFGGDTSEIAA
jgi:hypothetical protein